MMWKNKLMAGIAASCLLPALAISAFKYGTAAITWNRAVAIKYVQSVPAE